PVEFGTWSPSSVPSEWPNASARKCMSPQNYSGTVGAEVASQKKQGETKIDREKPSYKCTVEGCTGTFSRSYDRIRHHKEVHSKEATPVWKCGFCEAYESPRHSHVVQHLRGKKNTWTYFVR